MSDAPSNTMGTILNELLSRIASNNLDEVSTQIDELLAITNRVIDRNASGSTGDTSEYVAWLDNLNGGERRGAPPAASSAVEALETFEVGSSEMVCVVCKDAMVKGEVGKKLPCGHGYHEKCILPCLGTGNSCPICRFQLQTDDPRV